MQLLPHLTIGHATLTDKGTGLSAFLFDKPVICGAWLCGSAPGLAGTTPFLQLGMTVNVAHGLLLTGGSVFGLDALAGVRRFQQVRGIGLDTGSACVPSIPGACIYDLDEKTPESPCAEDAFKACQAATSVTTSGPVGAGCGATVGKIVNQAAWDQGGFGCAEVCGQDMLRVQAFVVVNAAGDIVNKAGEIIAGAKRGNAFADTVRCLKNGEYGLTAFETGIMNTTLVAVVTNASLDKNALVCVAKMASAGMASAIKPAFTPLDGDIVYAFSTQTVSAPETLVGTLAAQAVQEAIIAAVGGR